MKNVLFLITIITLIFISSCKTSYVKVQVYDPPEIRIPSVNTGLVVVNSTNSVDNTENNSLEKDSLKIFEQLLIKEASAKCIETIAKGLNNTPRFRKVIVDTLKQQQSSNQPPNWYFIEEICLKNRVSGMLSLESLIPSITINTKEIENEMYEAKLSSILISRFRLYDPVNKGYFEELPFYDSLSWKNTGKSAEEAISGLPDKITAARQTGIHSGNKYSERMTPVFFETKRKLYIKGNDKLKEAANYVKENNWRKAAGIWVRLARDTENKLIASYASYNMAVSEEVFGRLNVALSWANKSNKQLPGNSTLKYINILNKRLMELDRKK